MVRIVVNLKDLERFKSLLSERFEEFLRQGTEKAVRFYEQQLIGYTPARSGGGGGGGLRSSIAFKKTGDLTYRASPKYYFEYLDKGTGIHGPAKKYIKPVKAKALAWTLTGEPCEKGADCIYAKKVAGIKPFDMTGKAEKDLYKDADRIYQYVASRILK